MKFYIIHLFCLLSYTLIAQPAPAAKQKSPIAITGATVHTGTGTVIQNACVIFANGKISYVGNDLSKTKDIINTIDAKGKHIYPGFICPATNLGLAEIEQVKATIDYQEIGSLNANVRSLTSYNTDSKIIPTVRSNGMMLAQVIPNGGIISGQSSIVQLDAWNWEDAVIKADEGIFLTWPSPYGNRFGPNAGGMPTNEKYQSDIANIKQYFDQSFAYSKNNYNLKQHLAYESMRGLWNGSKTLYIRASHAKAMIHAVQFAKQYNINPVIVGGAGAWRIIDFLKEHKISIILSQTQALPQHEDDDIDQACKTPKILSDNGILFCLSMTGFWEQRNLMFQAGQAIACGLDSEQAIKSITLNTAKILGINAQCGSIEVGKDATLIICEGDVLDMRSHNVTRAFIQGRDIDLDNKQKELFRRFSGKYKNN